MEAIGKISILCCLLTVQLARGFHTPHPRFVRAPSLHLLVSTSDTPSNGLPVTGSQNTIPGYYSLFQAYSARGMWAFYDGPDFTGDSTAFSGDGSPATPPTGFTFAMVKSIRTLSNPLSVTVNEYEAFKDVNFVGDSTGVQPNSGLENIQAVEIKSIALYTYSRHVIMCAEDSPVAEDSSNCVCLNGLEHDSYIIPDLTAVPIGPIPASQTPMRVRKIRQLEENEEDICYKLPTLKQPVVDAPAPPGP